jgi:hypothetical protein
MRRMRRLGLKALLVLYFGITPFTDKKFVTMRRAGKQRLKLQQRSGLSLY